MNISGIYAVYYISWIALRDMNIEGVCQCPQSHVSEASFALSAHTNVTFNFNFNGRVGGKLQYESMQSVSTIWYIETPIWEIWISKVSVSVHSHRCQRRYLHRLACSHLRTQKPLKWIQFEYTCSHAYNCRNCKPFQISFNFIQLFLCSHTKATRINSIGKHIFNRYFSMNTKLNLIWKIR